MIDLLYIIFSNLFRSIVIFRFMNIFYSSKRFNFFFTLLNYAFFFFCTGITYVLFHNVFLNIFLNFLGIFFLTFSYVSPTMKRLSSATIIYLLNMACDGLVYISLSDYKIGNTVTEAFGVLTSVLFFLVELIAERLFKEKEIFALSISKWLSLLSIPIISGIILLFQILVMDENHKTIVVFGGILVLNVLLFQLYNSILKYYKENYNKSLLERKVAAYSNQLAIMEKAQKNYDSLKHDMNHHIRMIQGYLNDHDKDSIANYLNSISSEYFDRNFYVNSGNKEIDIILNYMIGIAKKTLKNVNYSVNIPSDMPYDPLTLNVVLGNLLDNAIYASQQSKDQFLNVSLSLKDDLLHIHISNSYIGQLKTERKKLITTKEISELHGIGLENVEEVLKKNNSYLKINYHNELFEAHVLYYLSCQ